MREWNCQLNISSNRWLHCRMLRNLFLLNHMGKPEKSCIWSASGTAVQEWLEQAKCLLLSVLALSLFTAPLSALTPPAQKPFFTLSSEACVRDDHLPVHAQLLLWAWETTGPRLFLFLPPSTVWTSAEAEWRLSNALLSLRILLVM